MNASKKDPDFKTMSKARQSIVKAKERMNLSNSTDPADLLIENERLKTTLMVLN